MLSRRNKALKVSLATALSVAQIFVGLPILFSWSDASAQADPPRVWMAPIQAKSGVSGAGLLAKKLDEVSRNQLRSSNDVEMSDQGYMGPITAGDEDPRIEEAERLRSAGKEAFAAGKKEKSLEMLKAALQRYEEGLPSLQKPEVLLETLGFLGAASVDLGYEADAKDYFRRLVALAPDAEPLDEYSDAAKKYFAKVKKKLLNKKRGAIRVVTKPKGALIRVDGVEVGKSPVTVRNLVRGYHYVQAQHADAGLAAAKVKVRSTRTSRSKLTLSMDVGPEAPGTADPEMVRQLSRAVNENKLNRRFKSQAATIAEVTKCRYVVVGVVAAEGNGFVLNAFIYGAEERQVVALDRFKFRPSLASALIQAGKFAKAVIEAANTFPHDKVLAGRVFVKKPVAPPPVAIAPRSVIQTAPVAPVPAPAPPPAKAPVTPKPAPKPAVVAKTQPAPNPTVAPAPAPPPEQVSAATVEPEEAPGVVAATVPDQIDDYDDTVSDGEKWYMSRVFMGVVGAVILGGAVAGVVALTQDGDSGDAFDVEVIW